MKNSGFDFSQEHLILYLNIDFKGFGTWGATFLVRHTSGDATFLSTPDGLNLCYPKLKLLIDFIIFSGSLE